MLPETISLEQTDRGVALKGRLDAQNAAAVWDRVLAAAEKGATVDASGVTYCDSSGAALFYELEKARRGIFPVAELRKYTDNYQRAGGKASLADYYTAKYDNVIMDPRLKRNVIFADHDLATDQVFGEMQVIFCRNVMIYFNRELQNRVFNLFRDSLDIGGTLCLGNKESLRFAECAEQFDVIDKAQRIYRKRV